jgi:diaminohydroxyphosphoribosylaminopyrimidine deaminase/5-amino-6-(5-phosphoribosylamino)uracil reductase
VIRSGVTRVVVPTPDPNPLVTGNGIKALQAAGIRVDVGLCADEARRANEFFFVYHEQKRPFIISKWAMTLDGKIATESGHSRWITNELSRAYAHEVRAQVDAVMVGVGTVLMDNPLLTVRLESYAGRQPKRVILDGTLRIPVRANCLTSASPGAVILATSSAAPPEKVAKLRADGHEVLVFSGKGLLDLHEVMAEFHRLEIQSILCEGGSSLTGSLFQAQIVDKVIAFMAPRIVGGNNSKNPIAGWGVHHMDRALNLRDITVRQFNDNVCIEGYLHKSDWSDSQPPKRNGTGRHRSIDPAKTPQGKAEKAE